MGRARKYDVTAGRIYVAKGISHRRVVATFVHAELGLRIVYSTGGDRNRECGYRQFRRWATANEATKAQPARTPRFALRQEATR